MSANLIESLQTIRDFRAGKGKRYPLWVILLLVVMGILSGAHNYQALEDFAQRHYVSLNEALNLQLSAAPSDTSFRRILHRLNYVQLAEQFHRWMQQAVEIAPAECFSIDGKGIRGTVSNGDNALQNFVSLVSVYSHHRGIVVGLAQFENKEQSELTVVQQLLGALGLNGVVFTLDALHAQKKQRSSSRRVAMTLSLDSKAINPSCSLKSNVRRNRRPPSVRPLSRIIHAVGTLNAVLKSLTIAGELIPSGWASND